MSGKTAKAVRKVEKEKAKDYERRKDAMVSDIERLSEKYRIDLVPIIRPADNGIFPLIAFVDAKEKYEQKAATEKSTGQEQKDEPKLEV